jgi:CDP-glucose 4,6-dehydratase
MALWLEQLEVEVIGLSLPPEPDSLYLQAGLLDRWPETFTDVRDRAMVLEAVRRSDVDLIIHMAAQPLVSRGYQEPILTMETNIVGTMNVLEAARATQSVRGSIIITTDKVYRPSPPPHRHTETDALGGTDPYAASKAASEHVIAAWRSLIAREQESPVVATRAGNVIGGGDAAANRLMPDLIRSFDTGEVAKVRQPEFTRPWQHVLDPLAGYLAVAERILSGQRVPDALNFGPEEERTVRYVADRAASCWGDGARWETVPGSVMVESPHLSLDSHLASTTLGWTPMLGTDEAVRLTVDWWKSAKRGASPLDLCLMDIADYAQRLRDRRELN